MCVYNSVNGEPGCANTDLLQKHLRQQWGFKGFVVSDCGAIGDILPQPQIHHDPGRGIGGSGKGRHGPHMRRRVSHSRRRSKGRHHYGSRNHALGSERLFTRASAWACSIRPSAFRITRFRTPKTIPLRTGNWRSTAEREVHRAVEEPGRLSAPEVLREQDRGCWPLGERSHRSAGQLQRHFLQAGDSA